MHHDSSETSHDGRHAHPDVKPNRLIKEKSPYLLQHAYNPVDWFPWGEEAFEKARAEDKPILLSIGYSTCHWCHVMERESFEDPDVAALMNDAFVSVKVDREERPDIDHVYMTVCQLMTGSGGWPLNIIMTSEKKPFFAGTYFPKESVYGRIGMMELAPRIKEIWTHRREEILQSADTVMAAVLQVSNEPSAGSLDEEVATTAYNQLAERFEPRHGGFGRAPKFPMPHNMMFLLRYWYRTGERNALDMVEQTLQNMRRGGVYDHVGFGFHRYAVDDTWLVPHFEKMLYDQALTAMLYTEAYQASGKIEYRKTAEEIFTYVLRDLTSDEGGFYSAEDADSEGEEGKFYVWRLEEIQHLLDPEETEIVTEVFNVFASGNFRDEATGRITGENILHIRSTLSDLAARTRITLEELETRLEQIRLKLFHTREQRIHPHKDDKILTDWNGLMIAALAKGAQAFDLPGYASTAAKAADFILHTLRAPDGRLIHRYRKGEAALPAHVDDYAFFIWGLLELYEATFQVRYLSAALELNDYLLKHFRDAESGGFYFTSAGETDLPIRKKECYDGAIPSGNSVAALNLLRLGRITADPELERKGQEVLRAFASEVAPLPSGHTQMMTALEFALAPGWEVVIAGRAEAEDTKAMIREIGRLFVPGKVVVFRPAGEENPEISRIAAYTKDQLPINDKATAFICVDHHCEPPVTAIDAIRESLTKGHGIVQ